MGISSRPAPTPRRMDLDEARDVTHEAAGDVRARGMITKKALQNMIDGKVSMKDVHTAERILERAGDLVAEMHGSGDFSVNNTVVAEEREEAASTLLDALKDQYEIQKNGPATPAQPSTTSTKR